MSGIEAGVRNCSKTCKCLHAGRIFAAKDEWAPEYRQLGEVCKLKAVQWNPPAPKAGPRKVVVAGWCGEVEDLTASLTMFAPQGTDVTMVCECAPEVRYPPRVLIPDGHAKFPGLGITCS